MYDPHIKVKVIADFKYGEKETFVNANTHIVFDAYDSTQIAEFVSLYSPNYPYKEFIELPSIDSLHFHVKQQVNDTYKLDKPKDQEYLEPGNKPFAETLGETFSPFGKSPYEDTSYNPKPLADNTYEPELHEPKFSNDIAPSIVEEVAKTVTVEKTETEDTSIPPSYSDFTKSMLALSKDELESRTANDIKKVIAELDKDYDYTNKVEAIKHLITFK